jgi:hypothetical protein
MLKCERNIHNLAYLCPSYPTWYLERCKKSKEEILLNIQNYIGLSSEDLLPLKFRNCISQGSPVK